MGKGRDFRHAVDIGQKSGDHTGLFISVGHAKILLDTWFQMTPHILVARAIGGTVRKANRMLDKWNYFTMRLIVAWGCSAACGKLGN